MEKADKVSKINDKHVGIKGYYNRLAFMSCKAND